MAEIIEQKNIEELIPDDMNFNKGTVKGAVLMDKSFKDFGAGRGIVLDKNGRIISGNKTTETALRAGIKKVTVIHTTGDKLVAVRRKDIDIDSKKGREMALADNVTSSVNFDIDYEKVRQVMQKVELHPEIWDVKMSGNMRDVMSRTEAGENDTVNIEKLEFCGYTITMSKEEYEELAEKAKVYGNEHGTMDGFIKHIINEYNENN